MPQTHISKKIDCGAVVPGCDWTASAETEEALMQKVVAHAAEVWAEEAAEAADAGKDFGTVRAFDHRLDAALDAIAEVHVHPGGSVGLRRRGLRDGG